MPPPHHRVHGLRLLADGQPNRVIIAIAHPRVKAGAVDVVAADDHRLRRSVHPEIHREVAPWVVGEKVVTIGCLVEDGDDLAIGARTERILCSGVCITARCEHADGHGGVVAGSLDQVERTVERGVHGLQNAMTSSEERASAEGRGLPQSISVLEQILGC